MQAVDLKYELCYSFRNVQATGHAKNSPPGIGTHWGDRFMVRERHTEWPHLEHYSNVPLFNTKAVVQQTGITAPTLRAWERRYMILSPERAQNDYRLYSERDIAIIRWLKERVDAGMAISQAIALFRHLEQEHHQLHRKDAPPGSTSPSQMMLSTTSGVEHEPIEGDEQVKKGAPQPALPNVQKFDAEVFVNGSQTSYNLRFIQKRLLEAFNTLDEATASQLMASILAIYSIEQVCTELITPTLWEIGRLWEQGLIAVSIEHFASAFFRGLLTNLLHVTPTSNTSPLVIACCAPGEEHELAPLILSLLLRRAGLRVAYLGQSIETEGLLQTVTQLTPALICVSVTGTASVEAVTTLGQKLQELPPPRPIFTFGGQAFEQHADLIAQVPGVYVDGDMQAIIAQLRRMAFQQVEHKD
ncbi:MAG TPA: MerR family transcriptional regulator [Ktedonobacteraceae bacterium]|nr:MerR family transcriptional regulator [Ktedonobacteraceae bacterium]